MNTISLLAQSRPEYTLRALTALDNCRQREKWYCRIFVDGGHSKCLEVESVCREFTNRSNYIYGIWVEDRNTSIDPHTGATNAAYRAFSWAFEQFRTNLHVAIEDDTVLSPDALELAEWFYQLPNRDDYHHLSLAQFSHKYDDPAHIYESDWVRSPWALVMVRSGWEFLKANWDNKRVNPVGWDWSLSYAMHKHDKWGLHPGLARALNIGREGGVHGSAEFWDKEMKDCIASSGEPCKYRIVSSNREREVQEWMLGELEREMQEAR